MNKDLTVGKPSKVLWLFCLPLFGSVIFQQLYNIADSFIAGKFIGEHALAAVGNSYEITLVFLSFATGCNMGCSVVVAEFFAAKANSKLKTAVATAFISTAAVCLTLMLIGIFGGNALLKLIKTPSELLADSKLYLDIYVYGLPFMFLYNVSNGIFSALGDSKTPFIFLACSSVANIGADILFVTVLKMGVAGVAWATFICQGVSCILAVTFVLLRVRKIRTDESYALFSKDILLKISKISIPSTIQQCCVSVGNIIIQSVINGFGAPVMAGYAAAIKLNGLVTTSFTTMASGMSNYTAQNLGANKRERVGEGHRAGMKMALILSVSIVIIYQLLAMPFMNAFIDNPTEAAVKAGVTFLRIVSPFYLVISLKILTDGVLRGAGQMDCFMIATFSDLLLRVLLSVFLSKTALGATGIWCAWPIGWLIGTAISITFYVRRIKRKLCKKEE